MSWCLLISDASAEQRCRPLVRSWGFLTRACGTIPAPDLPPREIRKKLVIKGKKRKAAQHKRSLDCFIWRAKWGTDDGKTGRVCLGEKAGSSSNVDSDSRNAPRASGAAGRLPHYSFAHLISIRSLPDSRPGLLGKTHGGKTAPRFDRVSLTHCKTLQNERLEPYLSPKRQQPALESLEGCVSRKPRTEVDRSLRSIICEKEKLLRASPLRKSLSPASGALVPGTAG